MELILLQRWNSLPIGFRMVGVPAGQAELLIARKIAVAEQQPQPPIQPNKHQHKPKKGQ